MDRRWPTTPPPRGLGPPALDRGPTTAATSTCTTWDHRSQTRRAAVSSTRIAIAILDLTTPIFLDLSRATPFIVDRNRAAFTLTTATNPTTWLAGEHNPETSIRDTTNSTTSLVEHNRTTTTVRILDPAALLEEEVEEASFLPKDRSRLATTTGCSVAAAARTPSSSRPCEPRPTVCTPPGG